MQAKQGDGLSLIDLVGDPLDTLAECLPLEDVKALRLTSRLCNVMFSKDTKVKISPLKSNQCSQFLQGEHATKWFARRDLEFDGSGFIEACHKKRQFFKKTNCMNEVQSLKVSEPSSYNFLYQLGDMNSLEKLHIYKGPAKHGSNGSRCPPFFKGIRCMELARCAVGSSQTRLLSKAENIQHFKLRCLLITQTLISS